MGELDSRRVRAGTATVLTAVLAAGSLIGAPGSASAASTDDVIACVPAAGTFGTAPWSLTEECVVHIGAGELGSGPLDNAVNNSDVRSIVFDDPHATSFGTSSRETFRYLPELSTIDGITHVDTSKLRYPTSMFEGASSLKELDLSGWDVSQVRSMSSMFKGASGLTSLDVSTWDTQNVTSLSSMFAGASALSALDVSGWNVSQVTSLSSMFAGASALTTLNISDWNTGSVTSMAYMFQGASALSDLDVSTWNTSKVMLFVSMFQDASSLTSLDVSSWDTSRVWNMDRMFQGALGLTALDLSAWDIRGITTTQSMFAGASGLISLDLSNWNTANLTNSSSMFEGASALTSLDLTGWVTGKLDSASAMFAGATSLRSLDLSTWDIANVTSIHSMFRDATALTSIDLSGWDTRNVTYSFSLFSGATSLSILTLGDHTLLPADARLPRVPLNTRHTGLWQSVGTGTVAAPAGDWSGSSDQLLARSGSIDSAGTYVWQPAVAPTFNVQPSDIRVDEGGTATLSISAAGNPSPTLKWEYRVGSASGWEPVQRYVATIGNNGELLTIAGDVSLSGYQFRAIATSAAGQTYSSVATLTVTPTPVAPAFSHEPHDAVAEADSLAGFYAHAWGEPAPTLRWQYRTNSSTAWQTVTSSIGSVTDGGQNLTLTATTSRNGYQFRAIATNSAGTATTAVATLTVVKAPTFVSQPKSIRVDENGSATFTVTSAGLPAPTVTWEYFQSGTGWLEVTPYIAKKSADGTSLTVTGTAKNTGLQFRAIASSPYGRVVSNPATLTVTLPKISLRVNRYQGANRYATNHDLNAKTMAAGKPLFVATGVDFPDALSVGPAVALSEGSLVLTTRDSIAKPTVDLIKSKKPSAVYIIGGTGVVSPKVATQLKSATGKTAIRIAGADRYETSSAIFNRFFKDRAIDGAFVATGRDYPDALSAASAGGALGYPVLLVNGKSSSARLEPAMATLLKNKGVKNLTIVGGTGVVPPQVARNIAAQGFNTSHRIWGADRYDTNLNLNTYLDSKAPHVTRAGVWVATGKNFPDALSAAAPAGSIKQNQRLVLSNGGCIPRPVVSEWIKSRSSRVDSVSLVGGTGVLNSSVASLSECR